MPLSFWPQLVAMARPGSFLRYRQKDYRLPGFPGEKILLEYGPATQGNDRLSDLMRQKIPWKIDIEKCLSDRYPAANIAWKFEHLQAGRNSKLQAEVEKKGVTDSCFLAAHETFRKYLIACGNLEK